MLLRADAPAKINLYLRVLGRRLDGYHEIDSLLLPLVFADTVELELELDAGEPSAVSCCCPGRSDLDGGTNLAARAARRYLEAAGRPARVELRLHKRVWVAAGLGGGSSDAAAVLRLLDAALGPLPGTGLVDLAARLGADVPFFLRGGAARALDRGDRLEPVPALPPLAVVLVNPGTPLPTPDVYAGLGLEPGQRTGRAPVPDPDLARLPEGLLDLVENDLAPVALRLCPSVGRLRRLLLEAGAHAACLTGSGPTVFGLFADAGRAHAAAVKLGNMSGFSVQETATACA